MYVYIRSEPGLWTVGFYSPDGKFNPESDYNSSEEAAKRVAYLNGGPVTQNKTITEISNRYLPTDKIS